MREYNNSTSDGAMQGGFESKEGAEKDTDHDQDTMVDIE